GLLAVILVQRVQRGGAAGGQDGDILGGALHKSPLPGQKLVAAGGKAQPAADGGRAPHPAEQADQKQRQRGQVDFLPKAQRRCAASKHGGQSFLGVGGVSPACSAGSPP